MTTDKEDNGISEKYTLDDNNTMVAVEIDRTKAALQERKSAWADSISLQDRITHGNFVTTLGVRGMKMLTMTKFQKVTVVSLNMIIARL